MFCLLLSNAGTASRIPLNSPRDSRLGVGKKWGGDTTRADDLNQPKGHSIPYDVRLSNKRWERGRKGGVERAFIIKTYVFPNNCYAY